MLWYPCLMQGSSSKPQIPVSHVITQLQMLSYRSNRLGKLSAFSTSYIGFFCHNTIVGHRPSVSARLGKERGGLCQGILKVPVDQAITKLSPLLTDFKENKGSQECMAPFTKEGINSFREHGVRVNALYEWLFYSSLLTVLHLSGSV